MSDDELIMNQAELSGLRETSQKLEAELKDARLRLHQLENELVKYKLLLAERVADAEFPSKETAE